MKLITLVALFLFPLVTNAQTSTYQPDSSTGLEYFNLVELNCPCYTEDSTNINLHPSQIIAYKKVQQTADSLSRLHSPCYEFYAKFICGVYYRNEYPKYNSLFLLDYDVAIVERKVYFQKPLPIDSTFCPAWQIVLLKKRSIELFNQDYSGYTICDDELD